MDNISIGKGRDATQLRRLRTSLLEAQKNHWSNPRREWDDFPVPNQCAALGSRGGPHVFSRKLTSTGIDIGYR